MPEHADFAQACADAGIVFIGPTAPQLEPFGDKSARRARRRLAFIKGRARNWQTGASRRLRHLVPETRLRAYDSHRVMEALVANDSISTIAHRLRRERPERNALFDKLVAEHHERGHGINMAQTLEIDAVIDPAETRNWLPRGLERAPVVRSTSDRMIDAC